MKLTNLRPYWALASVLGLTLACGDDSTGQGNSDLDASLAGDGDAEGDGDSGAATGDGGASKTDAATSNPMTGTPLIEGAKVARIAPSATVATIVATVKDTVPDCADGTFACNGMCMSETALGASQAGCTLLASGGTVNGLRLDGDTLYMGTVFTGEVRKVKTDGTGSAVLYKNKDSSVSGLYGDNVLLNEAGCNGERYDSCYSLLPKAGGTPQPLFHDLVDQQIEIVGNNAYYKLLDENHNHAAGMVERAVPNGSPKVLFSGDRITKFSTDGTWAYVLQEPFPDIKALITKLDRSAPAVVLELESASLGRSTMKFGFIHGEYVYLGTHNAGAATYGKISYERLKLGTTTLEALITLPYDFAEPIVRGETAYFHLPSDQADMIVRMPIAGGNLERVATFKRGELGGIQPAEDAIYVSLNLGSTGVVLKVALPK